MLQKLKYKLLVYNHLLHWKIGHWKSVWRRKETIEEYFRTHKVRKLQFGCWPYLLDGWINSELYGSDTLVPIDITKRVPVPDNSFDYLFSEHVIEHFSLEQGKEIFKEFHRILKPGGKVRIATPDLQFLVDLYKPRKTAVQKRYIKWATQEFFPELGIEHETFVINNFVRAWGHQFIYDFSSFEFLLKEAGFKTVIRTKPGKSKDKHLRGLEHHGNSFTEEFNQLETIVVEAQK